MEAQTLWYQNLGNYFGFILGFNGEEKDVGFGRKIVIEDDVEVFNFGKYKGRSVTEVLKAEPQYYDWMMKGDFPLHTKQKLTEILNRTLLKKQ